jgi:RNA polymerase sigma factor (sigma-70 family)
LRIRQRATYNRPWEQAYWGIEEFALPTSSTNAEQALLDDAIAGDTAAVEQLLLSHFATLERYLAPRIPADARRLLSVEDVLQETFAQAFRSVTQFDPAAGCSFFAWLKGIADHRLADSLRRIRRKKRGGELKQLSAIDGRRSSLGQFIDLVCDESRSPSRKISADEAARAIQIAIAGLPEHQHDVVWAHYIEHKSVQAIADETGRTTGAIRGLIDRAKDKIRTAMGRSSRWFSSR